MTPERALELMYESNQECSFWPKHLYAPETPEERKEVVAMWNTMPGYTCYYDALKRISKGEQIPDCK